MSLTYIDLFAGAGGLSEGFKRAGFKPIVHVEMDTAACYTLKTRVAYHYLRENNKLEVYYDYLKGQINRADFYAHIPDRLLNSVVNKPIGPQHNDEIFKVIDSQKNGVEVDMIVGGPPCQAYSSVGRGALKHKPKDERKMLYIEYGKYLMRYKPKLFVFENVPGLQTSDGGRHYTTILEYFKFIGYRVAVKQLNSWDFGVIQKRERLIIIGWKDGIDFQYPEFEPLNHEWNRDAIFNDLPALKPGQGDRFCNYQTPTNAYLETNAIRNGIDFTTLHICRPHNAQDLNIYTLAINELEKGIRLKNNQIPENERTQKNTKDFLDRFKVVGMEPHTMIAHIAKDGHHFIHPDKSQLRSISVREAARIQSFPDNFYFEGQLETKNRTAAFRQIGNAVPPLMAEIIAKEIKQKLEACLEQKN